MGCNTSQEQLAAPHVIDNENYDGQTHKVEYKESDNQNVTTLEKIEQFNGINTSHSTDKIKTNCDSFIMESTNEDNSEDKDKGSEKAWENDKRIKLEMQNSKEVDEVERAATKIQATFRGHKVRASMKQGDKSTTGTMEKKNEDKTKNANTSSAGVGSSVATNEPEKEPTKQELEAEFDPNDKELCDAATRIQSAFRSHLHRKLETSNIQDDKDLEEITKKVAEELDIDLSDPELNKAATKIQASFRGYKTRREIVD